MSEQTRGYVEVVTSKKEVNGKQLRSPLYSFKVGDEWFNCGFDNPGIEKGETIEFSYTVGKWGKDVDVKSISKAEGAVSKASGSKAKSNPVGDRQTSIVWQNQHGQAVQAVNFMVEQGIVKLPAKQADKYGVYMDLIKEIAVTWTIDALDPVLEQATTVVDAPDDDE